ncbi:MAG: MBL fold metallo-hydrolase [Desulfovibrio sp.]|jgi:glyoxylase-like metal-dependent hydrolase (beta-lactamase superfamily II)|nr:MBL fold metallo-hydrolase [Desulfovibrio sp.]
MSFSPAAWAICAALLIGLFPVSSVRAGDAGSAHPSVWRIGSMEVISLQDRPAQMPASLFPGTDPALIKRYMPDGVAPATISAFAVRQEGTVILVDAGYGLAGPGGSLLMKAMQEAGLTPERIDLVLLTHMHGDHIAGLVAKGRRVFPRAKVLVSAPEAAFWLSGRPGKGQVTNFRLAEEVRALYGEDFLPPFSFGTQVAPGITALDASGHTPGHTVFLLESQGQKLLIAGDLIHAAALQFPDPSASPTYDLDPVKAAKTRRKYLAMAADEGIPLAGMHLPLPAMGRVRHDAETGFAFAPGTE